MKKDEPISQRINYLKKNEVNNFSQRMFTQRKEVYERVLNETRSEPQVVRIARCLAAFLREKEIIMNPYDILAGHAQYCNCSYASPRSTAEEVQIFNQTNSTSDADHEEMSLLEEFLKGMRIGMYQRGPSGHVVAGYDRVLKCGFGALINTAMSISADAVETEKDFAKASLIICEAAKDYILRYAGKARELANSTEVGDNASQLEKIANACEWVSVNLPRDFFESVQLLWLAHEIIIYEQYCGSMSLGRLDQYLFPYYYKDVLDGTLTYESASEIIEALWIKLSGLRKGYQNVTLGGYSTDCGYSVNDLSYICIRASKKLKIDQPLLSVRWHKNIPEEFWNEIQELIEVGIGFPALFNDDVAITAKERLGISKEDAENYGIIGCVEITVPGKEFSHTEGFRMNWAKILELMLHNGVCTSTGETMKLKNSQSLESIKTFDEFYQWYKQEFSYFLDLGIRSINILDRNYGGNWPTPFLSSMMEGCLEKGRDVTAGGTIYNLTSINGCGMANVADSLAAIKKVVFEEKSISFPDLTQVLRNNFEGAEILRQELLNKFPKYGNDNNESDIYLKELADHFCHQVDTYRNPRGGCFQSGLYTVETHAIMGKLTGALPDGRLKGIALANALSPSQGADRLGPTAVMSSITKLDHHKLGNGMVLDLKFHPAFFNSQNHRLAFKYLVEAYFQLGGMEIQFNVISRETLINAQKSPEEYRDLIVRVSGFSAYFVTLDKVLQDEIIARTEYSAI